ncbi:MAG: hypothetical protein JRI55_24175 [Deltaproteobacteria bacterium]|nr:hypothetical protein [Deltaproteobacteria bacterium]
METTVRIVVAAVLCLALAACGTTMNINFKAPETATMELLDQGQTLTLPVMTRLDDGEYRVKLTVPVEYAEKLGLKNSFILYGHLEVGKTTENAKMTNVVLIIPDDLLASTKKEGKVIEAFTYDEGAGNQRLLSIKLGEVAPW